MMANLGAQKYGVSVFFSCAQCNDIRVLIIIYASADAPTDIRIQSGNNKKNNDINDDDGKTLYDMTQGGIVRGIAAGGGGGGCRDGARIIA